MKLIINLHYPFKLTESLHNFLQECRLYSEITFSDKDSTATILPAVVENLLKVQSGLEVSLKDRESSLNELIVKRLDPWMTLNPDTRVEVLGSKIVLIKGLSSVDIAVSKEIIDDGDLLSWSWLAWFAHKDSPIRSEVIKRLYLRNKSLIYLEHYIYSLNDKWLYLELDQKLRSL